MSRRIHAYLILLLISFNSHADITAANEALARGDYATAVKEFRRLAEAGDADAQANLGYMYYVGEGVPQSYPEAVKWYEKAAIQGNRDAQYNLAVAYAFGEGTKQDYAQAATWYRRAAEQGHASAQYSLGISYSYGEGIKQDPAEAVKWFKLAAEQGYVRAQVQLGSKYHTGDGVEQNYAEAVRWYRMAADRGDPVAQYNLGSMYRSGSGVSQDYNQAMRWFRLSADQGYAAAQNELASLQRSIAGAARTQTEPQLRPTVPAVVEKAPQVTATLKPEPAATAPAEKQAMFSVEKSDLLTLKDEKTSQPETRATPEVEKPAAAVEKEIVPETVEPATAMEETTTPETEAAPMTTQTIVEEKETKSKKGFFSRLFGKSKEKTQPQAQDQVEEETTMATDESETTAVAMAEPETPPEANIEPAPAAAADEELLTMDSVELDVMETGEPAELLMDDSIAPREETPAWAALEQETSVYADGGAKEEKKKSGGFFRSLFGKKDKAEAVAAAPELRDEPVAADLPEEPLMETTAMETAATDDIPSEPELMEAAPAVTDEPAAVIEETPPAMEVEQTPPEKRGFFRRLFGKKDKPETTTAAMEEPAPPETENAAVTGESEWAVIPSNESSPQYDSEPDVTEETPTVMEETEVAMADEPPPTTEAEQAQPEKRGFFRRLFGKKEQPETDAAREEPVPSGSEDAAVTGETDWAVTPSAKSSPYYNYEPDFESETGSGPGETAPVAETDIAMVEGGEEKKKKGFFGRLFGKSDKDSKAKDTSQTVETAADDLTGEEAATAGETVTKTTVDPAIYTAGMAALKEGNYREAASQFETAAAQGDANAQLQLGSLFYQGLGVTADYDEAAIWYRRAAEQGNAEAQYNLGNMYLMGEGVEQNDEQAGHWYEKAAEQGHGSAKHNLDNLRRIGESARTVQSAPPPDPGEAGTETVSEEMTTEPVPEKKKGGFFGRLFGKDKTADEPVRSEEPIAEEPPVVEAEPEIPAEPEPVAETETPKEEKNGFFGRLFGKKKEKPEEVAMVTEPENGKEPALAPAGAAAPTAMSTAVEDYDQGLAYSFGEKGVQKDLAEAFNWFMKSAQQGYAPAQYKIGVSYAYGEGTGKDLKQAAYWYEKAAQQGYAIAQRNLGSMYQNGNGVEINKPLALAWYSILADSGNLMDVRRRDSLINELTPEEIEYALQLKSKLTTGLN